MFDGALKDGGTTGTLANLTSGLPLKARVEWLPHKAQRLANALVGDQAERRGLFQLYLRAPAQSIVEYGIPGGIHEIGHQDRTLLASIWTQAVSNEKEGAYHQ